LATGFQLDSSAVLSEFQDGAVLLDLRTKQYLILNASAGAVCARLTAGSATIGDLVSLLCERYAVSPEEAERDVAALLTELEGERLVCPG
jgi:hypothetical protein